MSKDRMQRYALTLDSGSVDFAYGTSQQDAIDSFLSRRAAAARMRGCANRSEVRVTRVEVDQ